MEAELAIRVSLKDRQFVSLSDNRRTELYTRSTFSSGIASNFRRL